MGIAVADGNACLHYCLHLHGNVGLFGASANFAARADRLGVWRLLLPERAFSGWCNHHVVAGAVPVCVFVGAGGVSGTVDLCAGSEPHTGVKPVAKFLSGGVAVGASGDYYRLVAGLDGNVGGFWHGAIFRRFDLYHGDFPYLVWAG